MPRKRFKINAEDEARGSSLHMSSTLARNLYHELSQAALDSETKSK